MATLIDLFENSDKDVNRNTSRERLQQQQNGLRQNEYRSSIPILYGSEAIRIETQRTNTVIEMRGSVGAEDGGGLVGQALSGLTGERISSLNEGERFLSNKLGIPTNLTPTRVVASGKLQENPAFRTQETLAEIRGDGNGTIVGRSLAQTGGGTPSQIATQAIGQGISAVRQQIRGALLGSGPGDEENDVFNTNRVIPFTSDEIPYTDLRFTDQEDDARPELLRRLAETNNTTPFVDPSRPLNNQLVINPYKSVLKRNPDRTRGERSAEYYQSDEFDIGGRFREETSSSRRTIFQRSEEGDIRGIDAVIIRVGDIRFNLATITGISENFSPSWTSSQMVGNPFPQYTYDSITRDASFQLKMYSTNPQGHKRMWSDLERLAKLVYPLDFQENTGFITAPITTLTIGSMFRNKRGFISSLSYSVDDNGQWELGFGDEVFTWNEEEDNPRILPIPNQDAVRNSVTEAGQTRQNNFADGDWKLPKIIDVSLSFTFIESRSDVENNSLYSFNPIS